MQPEWVAELQGPIEAGVRDVIETVRDQWTDELPTTPIYHHASGLYNSTEHVAVPGEIIDRMPRKYYDGEFESVAATLVEQFEPDLEHRERDRAQDRRQFELALLQFTAEVLNYTGELTWDQDAFETAFDEQFEPRYADRPEYEILIPLDGPALDDTVTIDLDPEIRFSTQWGGPYTTTNIEIAELTAQERDGITTFERSGPGVHDAFVPETQVPSALRLTIERRRPYAEIHREFVGTDVTHRRVPQLSVFPYEALSSDAVTELSAAVVNRVRRGLLVTYPEMDVQPVQGYIVVPGWLSYRDIAVDVLNGIDVGDRSVQEQYPVTADTAREFEMFWAAHHEALRPDHDRFGRPIERLDQLSQRGSLEDKLIDCVIGSETTLLQGVSGSSNTFRLSLRGSLLLDERLEVSRAWLFNFFTLLYRLRSDIVHDDAVLTDCTDTDGEFHIDGPAVTDSSRFSPAMFIQQARLIYGSVLRAYIEACTEMEASISEVNDQLDRATRETAVNWRTT